MKTFIKIIFILFLIGAIGYGGICVYSMTCGGPDDGSLDLPSQEKAPYSVVIENTSGLILTKDYEVFGTEVGQRKYILHGFWQMRGQDFVYSGTDLVMDEGIFGVVTISRR